VVPGGVTRRGWLGQLLAGVGTLAAAAWHRLATRLALGASLVPVPVRAAEPPSLSPGEIDALVALAEVLGDGRGLAVDERRDLADALEAWARDAPDRRARYRAAALALDRVAGRPFAALDLGARRALAQRHRLDVRSGAADTERGDTHGDVDALRASVVPELIAAYWRSAAGWVALGYQVFPGRCGDLTHYTRPGP
jgi:hypothetical protein